MSRTGLTVKEYHLLMILLDQGTGEIEGRVERVQA